MSLRLMLWVFAASLIWAQADDLIVPGERVGPVSRSSTESELLRALGKAAVVRQIDVGEGLTERALVIYPNDPSRRLAVTWNDERPAHPATIFMCYGESGLNCRWHTVSGIRMGSTLRELESRNGRAFQMVGFGSDVGGNVVSFQGGRLEAELKKFGVLGLTLLPRLDVNGQPVPKVTDVEWVSVQGETFLPSSNPVLQRLNPQVRAMTLEFPRSR